MTILSADPQTTSTRSTPAIMFFTNRDWKPCGTMLRSLLNMVGNRVVVGVVDVWDEPETAVEHEVIGVPTVVLLSDGAEIDRVTGLLGKRRLARSLEPHLGSGVLSVDMRRR